MKWSPSEINNLSFILDQVQADLEPLNGKNSLVLCSAAGEIPFWLGERMAEGHILGVELNRQLLKAAQLFANKKQLSHLIEFHGTPKPSSPCRMTDSLGC